MDLPRPHNSLNSLLGPNTSSWMHAGTWLTSLDFLKCMHLLRNVVACLLQPCVAITAVSSGSGNNSNVSLTSSSRPQRQRFLKPCSHHESRQLDSFEQRTISLLAGLPCCPRASKISSLNKICDLTSPLETSIIQIHDMQCNRRSTRSRQLAKLTWRTPICRRDGS